MHKLYDSIQPGSRVIIRVFSDNSHVEKPVIEAMSLIHGTDCYFVSAGTSEIIDFLNDRELKFCGHDLIRDYYALMANGLRTAATAFDTAICQYVLDPSKSNYDLKTLVLEELHYDIKSEKEFLESSSQTDLLGRSDAAFEEYGFEWCRAVSSLAELQKQRLAAEDLENVCFDVEFPLIEVLASMEVCGVLVNKENLRETGIRLKAEIDELEGEIYDLAGEQFNINSPIQLGEILFDKLGLPAGKKTKRGYSTSADILEKIKGENPVVPKVLLYRTLTKLNSTYVEGLTQLIGPDGRIHAHFQQTVAATGRLSCTEPNLQNIPVRYEMGKQLRKAFVAEEGSTLIGADYSQIELRIMAHLSGDENLISAFNNGEDIHRKTAARVFDIDYDKVTSLDRSRAKAVNFGVIYGMSGFGLSEELHITRKEAEKYISEYFEKHQAVKEYLDRQVEFCRNNGYSKTIIGRKRYIHEISSSNYMTRQFGERLAMNSPIQGSAADIIKIAMNDVFRELKEKNMKSRLILQIHDELIISAVDSEADAVRELLVRNMENAMKLSVELLCDLNEGKTWYDLKD
jgi:DNA polymerase-1